MNGTALWPSSGEETPPELPTLQKPSDSSSPGFWGTLGQILSGLKVGVYRGRPGSSNMPGLSFNDLMAPVRDAQERKQLFQTYLTLGKNVGMDTSPFEQMQFGIMGPSPPLLKTMEGMYKEHLQYGNRRPMGTSAAALMIPQTTIPGTPGIPGAPEIPGPGPDYNGPGYDTGWMEQETGPPMRLPMPAVLETGELLPAGGSGLPAPGIPSNVAPAPARPGTPGTPETMVPLTPMQHLYRELLSGASPRYAAESVLPNLLKYNPELLQGTGGPAGPEKTRILTAFKENNADMPPGFWASWNTMPDWAFRGDQAIHTVKDMNDSILHTRQTTAMNTYRQDTQASRQARFDTSETRRAQEFSDRLVLQRDRLEQIIRGPDARAAQHAQVQRDRLIVMQLQAQRLLESQSARAGQVRLQSGDMFGNKTTLSVPQQVYSDYTNQSLVYANKFPKQQRQALEALWAAQTTAVGRAIVEELYRKDDPSAVINPTRAQQSLGAMPTKPPVFPDVQPTPSGALANMEAELARMQQGTAGGAVAAPPAGAPPPPGMPPPAMNPTQGAAAPPKSRVPLTQTVLKNTADQALTTLAMENFPLDPPGRKKVFDVLRALLKQQGYTDQEIAQAITP